MQERMKNPAMVLPDAMKGVQNIIKATRQGGASALTLELVHLRASQINGCSVCVYGGVDSARKAGATDDQLAMVAAWREAPCFSDAERAALALAEAITRLADHPDAVSDELWQEVSSHYNEEQLSAIILMIGLTNLFNRLNTTVRAQAGATWS